MNLFHLLFAIAVGFLASAAYDSYRRVKPSTADSETKPQSNPPVVIGFSAVLGLFLLLASVPGAFFAQPHWLTDKLYWVVERIIGLFT